jgi:hypothetical protein
MSDRQAEVEIAEKYGLPLPVRTNRHGPEQDLDQLWDARPELCHVRDFAYARMCSPWALLGVVILRILDQVPPWVTLPPIIGGPGSLNLQLALVGASGEGKGAAEAAASDVFDYGDVPAHVAAAGSGEGLAHQYAHRDRKTGEIEYDRHAVIFTASEIDSLAALFSRQGSTLSSQLRSAFMGERLGFAYADVTRRIPLEAHSYRMGLIVGVQPERAAVLVDQADGGTPQRFIWLPVVNPYLSDDPPEAPSRIRMESTRGIWKRGHVALPDQVAREVRHAHVARQRGEGEALNGHALFAREKVAYALALLADRRVMILDDWNLAGQIMTNSDRTRAGVLARLRAKQTREDHDQAKRYGQRQVIAAQEVADATRSRLINRMIDYLTKHGPSSRSDVRKAVSGPDRKFADDALDHAIEAGVILSEATNGGHRLRRA